MVITGTDGNDVLNGTAGDDQIDGKGGDDQITAGDGNDQVLGGAGNDTITGGRGADTLTGGDGIDTIHGGSGDDILNGDESDHLYGDEGNDRLVIGTTNGVGTNGTIDGGDGVDTLDFSTLNMGVQLAFGDQIFITGITHWVGVERFVGSDFADQFNFTNNSSGYYIDAGLGNDYIIGGLGDDTMIGGGGDDNIWCYSGNDVAQGGSGNDNIGLWTDGFGAHGHWTVDGGDGNDTFVEVYNSYIPAIDLKSGFFTIFSGLDVTFSSIENVRFVAGDIDLIFGTEGDNSLGHAPEVHGRGGNDTLYGTTGNDLLDGGAGVDTVVYDSQAATGGVTVDLAIATTQATGGSGSDTIVGVENLTGSSFDDVLSGDDGGNVLSGAAGADHLSGRGGDDTLVGGSGADVLDGGPGSDTASYIDVGSGVIVSLALVGPQDTDGGGTDTLISVENLTGSAFGDTLSGDAGANTLDGGADDDTLQGASGNDLLIGGAGADTLDGGPGVDTASYAQALAAVTVSLQVSGPQNTLGAGTDTLVSIEKLVGSSFADTLTANTTGATLNGGPGGDDLIGGPGNDLLNGGAASDFADYSLAAAGVTVSLAVTTAQNTVGAGSDILVGIEKLVGSGFIDHLTGDAGPNALYGLAGNDVITGGAGQDSLGGGGGADTFVFVAVGDSTVAAPDTILDFQSGDRIDLSAIDANIGVGGDQAFHVGATPGHAGDILVGAFDGIHTLVTLFVDGDATPDAAIILNGDHHALAAGDFVL